MQEAETKKYWSEPVQDRSFVSRLSLVQQKRPLLVSTGPLWKHWNELENVLLTSSSQWKHSSHVSLLWDAQLSAWVPSLSHFFFQTVNWTAPYFDANVLGERGAECSRIGQNKTKQTHQRNAYVAIVSLTKPRGTRKALNSHCTIAVAGRSAPLLPHLFLLTALPTRDRDPTKIARLTHCHETSRKAVFLLHAVCKPYGVRYTMPSP
ncbi:hypothetical protein F5888DRAFT_1130277 [Russula emetica]|nr:hypothetical protein F5888DRAFT_1130277 [Russula emetica]